MSSYRRNNTRRVPVAALVIVAVLGVAVLFGSSSSGIRLVARGYASSALASISSATESLGVSSPQSLHDENAALRLENEALRTELMKAAPLSEENARLRGLLSVVDHTRVVATARVTTRPGFSPFNTFVIAAGSDDGVVPGALVVASGNLAIGSVSSVNETTSLVSLFSAPGNALDARIGDNIVLLTGKGVGSGEADIPRGLSIEEGTLVFLPGTGYLLGTVASVTGAPEDAQLHVYVASPISLPSLEYVTVVSHP